MDSPLNNLPSGTTGSTVDLLILAELREIKAILLFFQERFTESRKDSPSSYQIGGQQIANPGYKCPSCNGPMVPRKERATGEQFFGCAKFPECKGTRSADGTVKQQNKPGEKPIPF